MATLKINVMSIVAIIVAIAGIVAVALYETSGPAAVTGDSDKGKAYEALVIIAIILALVVLVVHCADIERLTSKTFLIYAVAALLLLIGIIVFAIVVDNVNSSLKASKVVTKNSPWQKVFDYCVSSIVFAVVACAAAVAGAAAPFVCNK